MLYSSSPIFNLFAISVSSIARDSELQLMVFCGWADSPPQQPILMEFPSVCEIKVNGRVLEAVCREQNMRGKKNLDVR